MICRSRPLKTCSSFCAISRSNEHLKPLRDATPAERSAAWAKFLKDTDPVPGTAEHEGLRDYFLRIRTANVRYRDDGPVGWETDRGTAFVALGDPDNIYDSGLQDPNARVRQQVWEYRASASATGVSRSDRFWAVASGAVGPR